MKTVKLTEILWSRAMVPNLFGTRDWFCGRQLFPGLKLGQGDGECFCMIQVHYIYCANDNLYLQPLPSTSTSSSSEHQALDSHKECILDPLHAEFTVHSRVLAPMKI